VTAGAPTVTVPVLSRINVSTSEARSRKSALLMRMRRRVATVIAATMAAGPATTRAVGVATTRTAMARERSRVKNSVLAAMVSTSGKPHTGAPFEEAEHGYAGKLHLSQELHHPPEHGVRARLPHLDFEQPVQGDGSGEDRTARCDVVVQLTRR
jgi:hypothetical protein